MGRLMEYVSKNGLLSVFLPSKNAGKFRYKTRDIFFEFGESYATATKPYKKNVYLEWQIGYDVLHNDLKDKPTKLSNLEFIGANGRKKHQYELSELMWECMKMKLLDKSDIIELVEEIEAFDRLFNDEFSISIEKTSKENHNGILYTRGDIVLPSFFYKSENGNSIIEVAIKQQMYATGVQPMVYISIPITEFEQYEESLGKTSREVDFFTFNITKKNADLILNAFKIFGMCSFAHKHDAISILNLLIANVYD